MIENIHLNDRCFIQKESGNKFACLPLVIDIRNGVAYMVARLATIFELLQLLLPLLQVVHPSPQTLLASI